MSCSKPVLDHKQSPKRSRGSTSESHDSDVVTTPGSKSTRSNTDALYVKVAGSGTPFKLSKNTIASRGPDTKLARLLISHPHRSTFVFSHRDRRVFEQIVLRYYGTGSLPVTPPHLDSALVRHELDFWSIATEASVLRKRMIEPFKKRIQKWNEGLWATNMIQSKARAGYGKIRIYIQTKPHYSNVFGIYDTSTEMDSDTDIFGQWEPPNDIWKGKWTHAPYPKSVQDHADGLYHKHWNELTTEEKEESIQLFVKMAITGVSICQLHPILIHFYLNRVTERTITESVSSQGNCNDDTKHIADSSDDDDDDDIDDEVTEDRLRAAIQLFIACDDGSEFFHNNMYMHDRVKACQEVAIQWWRNKGFNATFGITRCECTCRTVMQHKYQTYGWTTKNQRYLQQAIAAHEVHDTQYPIMMPFQCDAKFYPRSVPIACVQQEGHVDEHEPQVFAYLEIEWCGHRVC